MKKINKKSQIGDGMIILVFLFAFGVAAFISLRVLNAWDAGTSSQLTNSVAINLIDKARDTLTSLDYYFIIIIAGFIIFTAISAFFFASSPALFWVSLVLTFFFIILAVIFGNVFQLFVASPQFTTERETFNIMDYLIGSKFVLIILAIMVVIMIVAYAKSHSGGGGSSQTY